jgi:hypothetical protein
MPNCDLGDSRESDRPHSMLGIDLLRAIVDYFHNELFRCSLGQPCSWVILLRNQLFLDIKHRDLLFYLKKERGIQIG